jgi:hypothetical protein
MTTGARWAYGALSHALNLLGVLALIAGLTAAGVGLEQPFWFIGGLFVVLGVVLFVEGAYRIWQEADKFARAYQGDTPLQRGLAESLRDARQIRGRLRGASDSHVEDVAVELWSWSGLDIHQWLDSTMGVDELAKEWDAAMPGVHTSDMREFEAALGSLSRERLLAYVDRGISLIVQWQRRLRDER